MSWPYARPGASNGPIIDMRMADMSHAEQVARRWDGLEQRIDSKIASVGLDGAALERLLNQAIRSGTKAQRIMWLRRAAEAVAEQALEAYNAMRAVEGRKLAEEHVRGRPAYAAAEAPFLGRRSRPDPPGRPAELNMG